VRRISQLAPNRAWLPSDDSDEWLPAIGPFARFSRRWAIRTTDPVVADFLQRAYANMLAPETCPLPTDETLSLVMPAHGRLGGVFRDTELVRSSDDPGQLVSDIIWTSIRTVVARSHERLILHSAAVALEDSSVVLLGPANTGKSTLAVTLLDRGFAYLTDEALAVEQDLVITGFPKPLTIDRGSWELLQHHDPRGQERIAEHFQRQWQLIPSALGSVIDSSHIRLVIYPTFKPHAQTSTRVLSPGAALSEGARCIFTPGNEPVRAARLRELAALLTTVPCYCIEYSRATEASREIEAILARH
jgi:hypothetical protein